MDDDQAEANALIEQANSHHTAQRYAEAVPLYQRAAELFPPYVSFHLVAGDSLQYLGRYGEAIDAYRSVVGAIPEHEDAWHGMAMANYRLGSVEAGDRAMFRFMELEAGGPFDADALVASYWDEPDLMTRAAIVNELVNLADDRVPAALHHFLELAAADRTPMERDLEYWSAQASILVRFRRARFVHWYTDGPAPDRDEIRSDLLAYLEEHSEPPPADFQQPPWSSPPPKERRPKPTAARWLRRLLRR